MANKHAVLSASSSERWLNCPPSARLCENYEDKGSDYAAEGTDAHSLCEFRLKQALGMPTEDPIENLSWYNEEMEECAAGYAAYVVELLETAKQTCTDPVVMIEQRVNFSRWVQDGFGTADCIVIADGVMNICDYKHGKGVEVSAMANPQMMLYVKPKVGTNKFGGDCITYEGVGSTKKWERLDSYGPKFVENIVQATARDILCYAMNTLRCCSIVMHIHDEVVIEADRRMSLQAVCDQMGRTPPWAEGLQLRADGYETDFYKKD